MEVRLFATLRQVARTGAVTIPPGTCTTAGEVVAYLCRHHPGLQGELLQPTGDLLPHVQMFVNGRSVRDLQGLATPVRDADRVAMFPPVAGGHP